MDPLAEKQLIEKSKLFLKYLEYFLQEQRIGIHSNLPIHKTKTNATHSSKEMWAVIVYFFSQP